MATLALAAPTVTTSGLPTAGTVLPAAETSLATYAGFSVPNNGRTIVHVVIGAAGTGTISWILQRAVEGQVAAPFTQVLSNSTSYLFGPFSPTDFNDVNGLLQATITVVTGNSVGAYLQPLVMP